MRPTRLTGLPALHQAILLTAEAWIAIRAPHLFRRSWQRARAQGFRPFHALPLAADEKFLWRKLVDRDPLHVVLSDKLAARDWVAAQGPDQPPMPRVLWHGTRAGDLPDALLTPDVVVKVNHNSGGVHVVARDGADRDLIERRVATWLADFYGRRKGEWGYFDIPRRVFVEERVGRPGVPLEDWKFYVFGGRIVRAVRIDPESRPKAGQAFQADETGTLRLQDTPPVICDAVKTGPPPSRFEEMQRAARRLGQTLDHVRVDFLADDRDFWLGELTLYSEGGVVAGAGYDPEMPMSKAWDLRRCLALRSPSGGALRRLYLRTLREALDREGP